MNHSGETENQVNLCPAASEEEYYLECEKRWIFTVLMFVAGFYGAFTYSIRGGIFCNAQTANFVLFAMALGSARWTDALYYLVPMSAYLLGAVVSEAVPKPVKKTHIMRWDTLLILIEMIAVVFLGLLPESTPHQVSQVTINFICSMQYNTFRQAQGLAMSTTFCTNHLRQLGIAMVKNIRKGGDDEQDTKMAEHFKMLGVFVVGGIISTALCRQFLGKAIWVTLIPLSIVFADLLYADRKKEPDHIEQTPHGH